MSRTLKIGISARFHKKAPVFDGGQEADRHIQYLETLVALWVGRNGGLPLMIPSASVSSELQREDLNPRAFARELDALVLQGGVDIHPSFYGDGEIQNKNYPFDRLRDEYELQLIEAFLQEKKPILGICRGFQLLNVYFGGTLHQDLETNGLAKHFDPQLEEDYVHEVNIVPDRLLSQIYGAKGKVTSLHHQGVRKLGKGLVPEAFSETDRLVEAFSLEEGSFVLGVQWHPEMHQGGDLLDHEKLFDLFLEAATFRKTHKVPREPKSNISFSVSKALSLGVELEMQIIDEKTMELKAAAQELLPEIQKRTPKVKSEIFQSMIELETGVCQNACEAEADFLESLDIVLAVARPRGLLLGSAGTHPFSSYRDRQVSPEERYNFLIDNKQWIARRIAIFGMHVHVGSESPDQCIELYRHYMGLAPLLLGISSSSPFYHSDPTGLCSVRSTFFESTPSGGHPPVLRSWKHFEELYHRMITAKAITSHKDLWWDVRPSPNYGTVEIRICDSMPTIAENAAVAALIHLLGLAYVSGKKISVPWPVLNEWSYRENKWRALRYGLDFEFILDDSGRSISAKDYLQSLLDSFAEEIESLGYRKYAEILLRTIEFGTPAERLNELYEKKHDLKAVVRRYCEELEKKKTIWY